ncbi:hypothetical protein, partial [Piscirickettsia litoralis]|uniref:hypothetical protein n=1 Tax=Piscirickettsia litoralis TaxID=1891921 RepID=UPI001F16859E
NIAYAVKDCLSGFLYSNFNKNMKEGLKDTLLLPYNAYNKYCNNPEIKSSFRMILFYNAVFFCVMASLGFIKDHSSNDNIKSVLGCTMALANWSFKLSYGAVLGLVNLYSIAKSMYSNGLTSEDNSENESSIKDYIKSMMEVLIFSGVSMYAQEFLQEVLISYLFDENSLIGSAANFISAAILTGYLFLYLRLSYEESSPDNQLKKLSMANGYALSLGCSYQVFFAFVEQCLPEPLAFAMKSILYESFVLAALSKSNVNCNEKPFNFFKPALAGQQYVTRLVKEISRYCSNPNKEPRFLVQALLKLSAYLLKKLSKLIPKSPTVINAPFYQLTNGYKTQVEEGGKWLQWLEKMGCCTS